MSSNPFTKNLERTSDPSDWKNTKIPVLSQLESLQRCYICKEFLTAPVVTSCNHTFCSRCVREYLMKESHCPLCKSRQLESDLRRVTVLEEIVNCFSSLRDFMIMHLAISNEEEEGEDKNDTENLNKIDSQLNSGVKRLGNERSSSPDVIEIMDDDNLEPPVKKSKIDSNDNNNDNVQCPVCSKKMPADFLQSTHIDECLNGKPQSKIPSAKPSIGNKTKKPNIKSFFKSTKPTKKLVDSNDMVKINHEEFYFKKVNEHKHDQSRLSKLDFRSLNTTKLKEKMSQLDLPVNGSRPQLEARYNQYYVLFNSNLDSSHPVDPRVLRMRLKQWECSHLSFGNDISNLFSNAKSLGHKSILDKNFSVSQWKQVYQHDFIILTKNAKRSKKLNSSNSIINTSNVQSNSIDKSQNSIEESQNSIEESQNNPTPPYNNDSRNGLFVPDD